MSNDGIHALINEKATHLLLPLLSLSLCKALYILHSCRNQPLNNFCASQLALILHFNRCAPLQLLLDSYVNIRGSLTTVSKIGVICVTLGHGHRAARFSPAHTSKLHSCTALGLYVIMPVLAASARPSREGGGYVTQGTQDMVHSLHTKQQAHPVSGKLPMQALKVGL